MAFTLSPLPYAEDALEGAISARALSFHYHKHHKTYVDTLNKLSKGARYETMNSLIAYLTENCCRGRAEQRIAVKSERTASSRARRKELVT